MGIKKQIQTDEELIKRFCNGNNSAFDSLYKRYYAKLLYFIIQSTSYSEAESKDILQDVFMKVIDKRNTFDISKRFSIWIYTITSNKCKNAIKRNSIKTKVEKEIYLDIMNSNGKTTETTKLKAIRKELRNISTKHKQVFLLRFNFGFTIKETADILEISEGTVKSRLYNCIQNLSSKQSIKSLK